MAYFGISSGMVLCHGYYHTGTELSVDVLKLTECAQKRFCEVLQALDRMKGTARSRDMHFCIKKAPIQYPLKKGSNRRGKEAVEPATFSDRATCSGEIPSERQQSCTVLEILLEHAVPAKRESLESTASLKRLTVVDIPPALRKFAQGPLSFVKWVNDCRWIRVGCE